MAHRRAASGTAGGETLGASGPLGGPLGGALREALATVKKSRPSRCQGPSETAGGINSRRSPSGLIRAQQGEREANHDGRGAICARGQVVDVDESGPGRRETRMQGPAGENKLIDG